MAAESELKVTIKGKDELSPTLAQLESKIIRWVGAISASLAAIKIGTAPIAAAREFERSLADVAKTTNFTLSEMKALSAEILTLSTRTDVAANDLAKIAAAAGQQGLGKFGVAGVVAFTESVSRMASALDVTAEEAGTNVGKIVNVFKVPLQEIERVVSTLNEVSNNSTASGKELLDVVKRIGDAAGALNLEQATALAATGLDLGSSPEVVGTAFSEVFASLRQDAAKFGKLLGEDADMFASRLKNGGITALKDVLAAFRNLKVSDQQTAITKLFGSGRIGTLVNKLVQDTQNTILDQNLRSAAEGSKGSSAIKEQEKILNTLDAQTKAALNSLYKLGVDITQSTLGPLTQYVAQFNQALQSEDLRSFLRTVVTSIMEMVDGLISAVKYVASLNVNWENFVAVAKVFAGLKIAQYFGGALQNSTAKFAANLKLIATGQEAVAASSKTMGAAATSAAAQQAAADTQFKGSIAGRLLGYEQLEKQYKARKAALAEEALAEKAAAAASQAAIAAKANASVVQGRATAATSQTAAAAQAAQAQRAALAAAQQQAATAEVAAQQAKATRIAAAETASNVKLLAIEEDYQNKKAAIKATGTTRGMTALKAETEALRAAEAASYAKSLAGIEAYYAKRTAAAVAGGAALVNAEKAALMQRLSVLDGAMANQATKTVNLAASTASIAAADAALVATTAKLSAAQKATALATTTMLNFGNVMKTVGSMVAIAGRLIASGFFWVTIIYSLADAFGLLDGLGGKFQMLTDKIGLTSEAMRKEAVEREKKIQQLKDEEKAVDDLIEKYSQYTNAASGKLDSGAVNKIATVAATTEDQATKLQAIAQLQELDAALVAERMKLATNSAAANDKIIADQKAKIVQFQTEIADLMGKQGTPLLTFDALGFPTQEAADFTGKIQELREKIRDAELQVKLFGEANENTKAKLQGLSESSKEVGQHLASMFTPETLTYAQEHVAAFAELSIKVTEAKKAYDEASQAARGGGEEQVKAAKLAEASLINLRAEQDAARKAIETYINTAMAMPGVPENVKASWEQLKLLIQGSAQAAAGVIAGATVAVANGAKADGKGANPNKKTEPTGNQRYTGGDKGGESKARKEAKARLELERATIQAENNLKEEGARQALQIADFAYEQGLTAFRDYYKQRNDVQMQANQFDIDDKKREIAAVEAELRNATEKSEQLKFQTQKVKLEGQINVLQLQKKSIQAQNAEDQRRAEESFGDRIREETNRLVERGIIPREAMDSFQGNLDEMLAQYRVFIAQLRVEGKDALADSLIKGFRVEALQRTLEPINRDIAASMDTIGRYQSRLGMAVQNGVLTSVEAAAAYDTAIKSQIAPLQDLLAKQEQLLANNAKLATESPREYQVMADAIDSTRLRLEQLNTEADKTAKEFNQQTTDSLSNILGQMELSAEGIKNGLKNFLLSIAKSLQQSLGKALSESIMQSLGQTGAGGLGGLLQGILQGGRGGQSTGVINGMAGKAGITLGSSPTNPMFVQAAAGALGLDKLAGGADEKGFEALIDKLAANPAGGDVAQEGTQQAMNQVSQQLEEAVSGFADDFSGLFDDLGSTLTDVFSEIAGAIGGGGGGGAGGWVGLIMSLFHRGGIAGTNSGMSRKVNPMLFAGAPRYHGGGIAGLQPDEVPAVLEKGEEVLTANDPRHRDNQAGAEGAGGGTRILNILDPDLAKDFMESSAGEKVIMNHIRNNAGLVSQIAQGS